MNMPFNQGQTTAPSFREFAASTTPEAAKNQIEEMLKSGRLTQEQLNQAEQMARNFLSMMGR